MQISAIKPYSEQKIRIWEIYDRTPKHLKQIKSMFLTISFLSTY